MKLSGANIFKRVEFKLFTSDNRDFKSFTYRAPRGQYYTEQCVETCREHLEEQLRQEFPAIQFRFVRVGKNAFNVLHQVGHA